MRKFLLIGLTGIAAITFSQVAAAQATGSRNGDAGASTEPRNPADASISTDAADTRADRRAARRNTAKSRARDAGAGATGQVPRKRAKQADRENPAQNKPRH